MVIQIVLLALFARYYYRERIVDTLKPAWPDLLESRLEYASQSVSAAFYAADKSFIDIGSRL